MDFGRSKMRMNVEEGDRLSSLPDDLIHKILAFMDIKNVIRISMLSSRWRFIWTSRPYLNFSTKDYAMLPKFSKFVSNVLSRRNNLADLYSVKLSFRGKLSQVFVKKIMDYAFSHSIQQLDLVCFLENNIEFPLSLFSSKSLKHLSLATKSNIYSRDVEFFITPTSTWELLALTTLELHNVILCDDNTDKCIAFISKCANLINLTLKDFKTKGSDSFSICHPRLSNLTLENGRNNVKVVNVAAPQLKNLTIRFGYVDHVISDPYHYSLTDKPFHFFSLISTGFHSLEKAEICISSPNDANAHQIVSLLQQLHHVKFLTLSLDIIEMISSSVDPVLQESSPFVNLKSIDIYKVNVKEWELESKKVTIMSSKLKSYPVDSSLGSTFIMVLLIREEILAQQLLAKLGVLLEEEKHNPKTNWATQRLSTKNMLILTKKVETKPKLTVTWFRSRVVGKIWESRSVKGKIKPLALFHRYNALKNYLKSCLQ